MNLPDAAESPLRFPCVFPIKAFGRAADFDAVVLDIVRRHVPSLDDGAVSRRPSRSGNYTAITVTVTVESRVQLDAIYQDLAASPLVIMAL